MKTKNKLSLKLVVLGLSLAALPRIAFGAHPVNEDEWYDPSDWFDNNNVESDDSYDAYDYTTDETNTIDDNDYYDGYWEGLIWYEDYDDYDAYDVDYVWNPVDNEWVTDYDYNSDYDSSQSNFSSAQQSASTKSSQSQTLKGTVEAFTQVGQSSQTGSTQNHALARISLDKGGSAVVDLGLASLFTADLKKGDKVTLKGQKGQIDGQNVFVAEEFKAKGETVYIDRAFQMNQEGQRGKQSRSSESDQTYSAKHKMDPEKAQSSSSASQSQETDGKHLVLEGKIDRLETVKLSGEKDRQRLARIKMQDGKAATVNFGSELSAKKLELEKGDKVRIQGTTKKIDGRTVLMAESVKLHT